MNQQHDPELESFEAKPNGSGLSRILKATHCSMLGFKAAYRHEAAFRQEFWLSIVLTPLAWFISQSFADFVTLIVAMLFVLVVELLNSAIESVVDRIGLERHELSGRAKDLASAAVTVSLLIASLLWLVQIINYLSA